MFRPFYGTDDVTIYLYGFGTLADAISEFNDNYVYIDAWPLTKTMFDDLPEYFINDGINRLELSSVSELGDYIGEYAQSRYYYRMDEDTSWILINKNYTADIVSFTPAYEGTYYFKVESKNIGETIYSVSDESGPVEIFFREYT